MRRALAAAAAIGLMLLVLPPARAADPEPIPRAPEFGAVETYHEPEVADQLGLGWTRIIFYWSELKKDGRDEWNIFHQPLTRIDREIAGGREVVGLLQHTPVYATDGSKGSGVPRGLYLPLDDPGNEWAVFLREVMTAYEGRIRRWIIWNEPDIPPDVYGTLWEGSTADYYQLVKTAYLIGHEIDPEIRIHLGGLTYWHNPTYLDEYLDIAADDPTAAAHDYYFDVVSVHLYFKPETTIDIISTLRAALEAHGLDKPIWLNETNAPPYDDPAQPWQDAPFMVTQAGQADFLLQELALARAMGVERVGVYKFIDEPPLEPGFEPYGLIRTDRSERPGYAAFETAVTWYGGADSVTRISHPLVDGAIFDRGERGVTRVLWARGEEALVADVPALAESGLLVRADGTATPVRARDGRYMIGLPGATCEGECLMGGEPLLIVEEDAVMPGVWEGPLVETRSALADEADAVNVALIADRPGRPGLMIAAAAAFTAAGGALVWRGRKPRAEG